MKLLALYLKEREDKDLLLNKNGFVIYKVEKDYIYIQDVFVEKEKRERRAASLLVDEVARFAEQLGIKELKTTSDLRAKNPGLGMRAILGYGFEPETCHNDIITYSKKI